MLKPGNERSAAFKARRGKARAGTRAPSQQRSFCYGHGAIAIEGYCSLTEGLVASSYAPEGHFMPEK
jgi:hypothetical protein